MSRAKTKRNQAPMTTVVCNCRNGRMELPPQPNETVVCVPDEVKANLDWYVDRLDLKADDEYALFIPHGHWQSKQKAEVSGTFVGWYGNHALFAIPPDYYGEALTVMVWILDIPENVRRLSGGRRRQEATSR